MKIPFGYCRIYLFVNMLVLRVLTQITSVCIVVSFRQSVRSFQVGLLTRMTVTTRLVRKYPTILHI